MTALDDLWHGNINPHETFLNGNCRFKHLRSLMGKSRDNLNDTLSEQQKEILAKYDDAVNEMHSLAEEAAYQSLFEQMGGTYTQQGDYYLPNLKLQPEEERPVDVWGQRRLRYLREHRPILYTNLKTICQIRSHLADVEEQANTLFLRLVKGYATTEGVTEQLKATDPMEWARRMNGIRARATEIVNSEAVNK